jgi:hypothetical protein
MKVGDWMLVLVPDIKIRAAGELYFFAVGGSIPFKRRYIAASA